MRDDAKTKAQLIRELHELRRRMAELESAVGAPMGLTSGGRPEEEPARYRELVENSQGLITSHALDGTLLAVNPAVARSLGYGGSQLPGRNICEFLAPEVRQEFGAYVERIKRLGVDEGLVRVVTCTGEQRIWAYRNVLRQLPDREAYVLGHALDVTELKRVESALRESEAKYRALVDHASYGIFRLNPACRFLAVNPALVTMLGYESATELLALENLQDLYPDGSECALLGEFSQRDRIEGSEQQWSRKDGSRITVRVSGRMIRDERGDPDCYEMIAEDVTRRQALEAQFRQIQKLEAIGQLTAGIAHDFNNILTIVLANAELIKTALPPDRADLRADLDELRAAGRRGTSMVKMLLGFGRREMLNQKPAHLAQIVSDMETALRRLAPETVEIRLKSDPSAPQANVDCSAVERILVNLASNARDAMPDGGIIQVDVQRAWLDAEHRARHGWGAVGEYVFLSVSDTGQGMDPETRSHVFEPFFTTKPPGKGTGLGMAMIYGLVKQQGGYVDVQSDPGAGTTVRVYFPTIAEPT